MGSTDPPFEVDFIRLSIVDLLICDSTTPLSVIIGAISSR